MGYLEVFEKGCDLMDVAAQSQENRRPELFQQAAKLFEECLDEKMDFHPALGNLGAAYIGLAMLCAPGKERYAYAKDAAKRSEEAVLIVPDNALHWFAWGTATELMAANAEGSEKIQLLTLACERFEKGVTLGYRNIQSLTDWGTALMRVGWEKKMQGGIEYYDRCLQVFEEALALEPGNDHLNYNLGNALCQRAALPCDNRCELLERARECMARAAEVGDPKHMYHVSVDKIGMMLRQAGCND